MGKTKKVLYWRPQLCARQKVENGRRIAEQLMKTPALRQTHSHTRP